MGDLSSSSQLRGLVGATLRGRYTVERLLALDELGGRFAARQLQPERAVSLRVLGGELDGAALERDSRTFTQLEHRGCLRILSVSKTEAGQLFLVTEAITGEPLASASKGWSAIELLDAAAQLLEVVGYAHQRGVTHGLLGPRSVFGETQGDGSVRVVVADFGLARLAGLGPKVPAGTQVYGASNQAQLEDVAAASGLVRALLQGEPGDTQLRAGLALLDEGASSSAPSAASLAEGMRALWAQARAEQRQSSGGAARPPGEAAPTLASAGASKVTGKIELPPLEPGRVIAERFRLEAPLGKGGMGVVWKATHLALQAPVAIKLLFPSQIAPEEARARFLREARASAALRSSHIVQVFDYGVHEGMPYLVMELLEGETLEQRIERGALGYAGTVAVMRDVCAAIGRAHELEVIHRDLKPANIFLVSDEHDDNSGEIAKVLDFGIAKFLGNTGDFKLGETKTGALLGTPYYMSPEQLQESKSVDHRSDLWALGVITYQCLTGQRPFDSNSLVELCISITTKDAPSPEAIASLPAGVDTWMHKALAREPDERFASAKQMFNALEAVGDAQRVKAPMPKVKAARKRSSLEEPVFELREGGPALGLEVPAGTPRGTPGEAATVAAIRRGASPNVARERSMWPFILIAVGLLVLGAGYVLWSQDADEVDELAEAEGGAAPAVDAPAAGEKVIEKPVSGYGDECAEDSECAWDDACVPSACVGINKVRSDVPACEEAAPEPGSCSCIDHHCVQRRDAPPAEAPSCASAPCGLDQARGVCVAGKMEDANEHLDVGPACLCAPETKTCELTWIEAIPCKSTKDCWVTDTAPFRPTERAKDQRGREFRPCRDGEFAPTCRSGQCALISYSCD